MECGGDVNIEMQVRSAVPLVFGASTDGRDSANDAPARAHVVPEAVLAPKNAVVAPRTLRTHAHA